MSLITLRQLLDHAAEYQYGVPAFNVSDMEQIQAVLNAAHRVDAPVILQFSRSARAYAGDNMIQHMIAAGCEQYPHLPICIHQDHGNDSDTCLSAMMAGFTSVMMDGSLEADGKTPATYDYNVDVTRRVVCMAHAVGVSVEGELGCLGSLETGTGEKEDGHGFEGTLNRKKLLTDPDEAADFVARTHVDALAIAVGTSHGAYKFSRKPTGDILAMDVVQAIHCRLPHTHLVMHGASAVSEDIREVINQYGGDIPATFGVPLEDVEKGIAHGIRKINIDTDNRLAMTAALRKFLAENASCFDPRRYFCEARAAMEGVCLDRFERFGAAGRAHAITPIPREEMARRYVQEETSSDQKAPAMRPAYG